MLKVIPRRGEGTGEVRQGSDVLKFNCLSKLNSFSLSLGTCLCVAEHATGEVRSVLTIYFNGLLVKE